MLYDDYVKTIGTMTAENFQTVATTLMQSIKEDCETRDALTERCNTQDNKIRDLQDTNAKLFLSITSPASKVDDRTTVAEKTAQKEIEAARAMGGLRGLFE